MAAPRISRSALQQGIKGIARCSKPPRSVWSGHFLKKSTGSLTADITQHKVTSKSCSAYLPFLSQAQSQKSSFVFQARCSQLMSSSMMFSSKTSCVNIEVGSCDSDVLEGSEDGDEVCSPSESHKALDKEYNHLGDG